MKGNIGFYLDDWHVIRYIKGFWYYIIPRKREECNYDDEFFDYSSNKVIISKSKIKFINEVKNKLQLNNIETQFAKTADLTIEIEQKRQTIGYNFINGYPVVNIDLTLYCKLCRLHLHQEHVSFFQ